MALDAHLSKPSVAASVSSDFSLNGGVTFAPRKGLLHHRPSDGAVIVLNLLAHALHGDVRLLGRVATKANDNQRELKYRVERSGLSHNC